MKNRDRFIVKFLKKFCSERDYVLIPLSDHWIFQITKGDSSHIIFGYDLGLNRSTTNHVCRDKAATHALLEQNGVPSIPHTVFLHPEYLKLFGSSGNWAKISELFEDYGRDVVLKPNDGTAGRDVFRASDQASLEESFQAVLQKSRSVAISPFVEIENEIRVYVLDGEAQIVLSKTVPTIIGDGASSFLSLAEQQVDERTINLLLTRSPDLAKKLSQTFSTLKGEKVRLNWKHNLGLGSLPMLLKSEEREREIEIACAASRVLNLRFGSVDLALASDGSIKVLEANSGVMVENFARMGDAGNALASDLYEKALDLAFRPNSHH